VPSLGLAAHRQSLLRQRADALRWHTAHCKHGVGRAIECSCDVHL
jgi:hypothetical protein